MKVHNLGHLLTQSCPNPYWEKLETIHALPVVARKNTIFMKLNSMETHSKQPFITTNQ